MDRRPCGLDRRSGGPSVSPIRPPSSCGVLRNDAIVVAMEFLNFLIILSAAWLIWRRPERERLAYALLIISCLIMALLFLIGTHTSLVPGVNL